MFDKIKRGIHDWAYDVDGLNARKKEAMEQLTPSLDKIEQIWNDSPEQSKFICDMVQEEFKVYNLGGNAQLVDAYKFGRINKIFSEYQKKGIDANNSFRLAIKKEITDLDLKVTPQNLNILMECLKTINNLNMLITIAKENAYVDNALLVYTEAMVINSLQKKYADLKDLIGEPININEVLGENGQKLQAHDPQALAYVEKLRTLAINIKTELSFIKAREIYQSRK